MPSPRKPLCQCAHLRHRQQRLSCLPCLRLLHLCLLLHRETKGTGPCKASVIAYHRPICLAQEMKN